MNNGNCVAFEEDVAVAAIAAGKARFKFGEKPDV